MSKLQTLWPPSRKALLQVLVLSLFYAVIAARAVHTEIVTDQDLWWHLRTGQWIVAHGAVPTTDTFSQVGQGQPLIAYSWLFEVLIYQLLHWFGLAGVVGYTAAMTLLILAALFWHLRQFVDEEGRAVVYMAIGGVTLIPLYTPRPWLFTLLFFIVESGLLTAARRRNQPRLLWWLVPLFVLWANLHIQFIYGLFLLGFETITPLLEQLLRGDYRLREHLRPRRWRWLLLCGAATLVTPYHFHLYRQLWDYVRDSGGYIHVTEMQPLSFSQSMAWLVLGLTLLTVFRLGERRAGPNALSLLLLIGVFLSFRSTRDIWFLVVVALTLLMNLLPAAAPPERRPWQWLGPSAAVLLAGLALLVVARQRQLTNETLQQAVSRNYPAAAARVIEERGYPGPLYNHFDWGGYLIWRLPQLPVSMDGRGNIYGAERIARHVAVWRGARDWAQDPQLKAARLIVADVQQPLCELLRLDPRFTLVYEDEVAAVFRARADQQAEPPQLAADQKSSAACRGCGAGSAEP